MAADGKVMEASGGRSCVRGADARREADEEVEGDPPLTPATEWKIAGTPVAEGGGREFVTGKHKYPSDIARPGMMYGEVVRAAGYQGKAGGLDTSAAEKMAGVKVVRDGEFIGVVAADVWTAEQAA